MRLTFFLPLVLGSIGSLYFMFLTEEDWKWKILAVGTMGVSMLLQFVPALQVHFVIPLVLQTLVSVWMVVYWKLDG